MRGILIKAGSKRKYYFVREDIAKQDANVLSHNGLLFHLGILASFELNVVASEGINFLNLMEESPASRTMLPF